MVARASRAAALALRGLLERHLGEHGWTGAEAFEDTTLDWMNLSAFLLAALDYAREAHPLFEPNDIAQGALEANGTGAHRALADALRRRDRAFSVDACVDALADVVSLEIVDAPSGRRDARPRAYLYDPTDWPPVLAHAVDWTDCVFGIVAEGGWVAQKALRDRAFRALSPVYYEGESFVEIDDETAVRLARALLAGPGHHGSVDAHDTKARAFLGLFGGSSRCFANRDFGAKEIERPFGHVEITCWSVDGYCSSGRQLVLVVTDGARAARLDARWDISAE